MQDRYFIGQFNNGCNEATMISKGTSFVWGDGGSNNIGCYPIAYKDYGVIGFITCVDMAQKICNLLNASEIDFK